MLVVTDWNAPGSSVKTSTKIPIEVGELYELRPYEEWRTRVSSIYNQERYRLVVITAVDRYKVQFTLISGEQLVLYLDNFLITYKLAKQP